jgi:hypothetical protein
MKTRRTRRETLGMIGAAGFTALVGCGDEANGYIGEVDIGVHRADIGK